MLISAQASFFLHTAGRTLTDYMLKLLYESSGELRVNKLETIRGIKEAHCYVAPARQFNEPTCHDHIAEIRRTCSILDCTVDIDKERFRCPEALFCPYLVGYENYESLREVVIGAIGKCDPSIRATLYANIVLVCSVCTCSATQTDSFRCSPVAIQCSKAWLLG